MKGFQFGEGWHVECFHVIFAGEQELTQGIEGVFITVNVHEHQGGYVRHSLTISNLDTNKKVMTLFIMKAKTFERLNLFVVN